MFNILILLALQFFILSKDKCKMLTKMLTLSKGHQIETSSMAGTRVQVISNKKQEKNWLVIDNLKNKQFQKLTIFQNFEKWQFSRHSSLPSFEGNKCK